MSGAAWFLALRCSYDLLESIVELQTRMYVCSYINHSVRVESK